MIFAIILRRISIIINVFHYSYISSYSKVLEQKEQLEQKHLHLLQILDSERQAKWHYVQQTEEFTMEVKKLKNEVTQLKAKLVSFDFSHNIGVS